MPSSEKHDYGRHDKGNLARGRAAWHMTLDLVLLGHNVLGFEYEMSGDHRAR